MSAPARSQGPPGRRPGAGGRGDRPERRTGAGAVLWPEQGPVRDLRLPGAAHHALRRLLLSRRRGGRPRRRPHDRALVQPPEPGAGARVRGAAAADPVRQPPALSADRRPGRRDRRGHGRRDRGVQAAHHHAHVQLLRGDGPRAGARAGARLSVRHQRLRPRGRRAGRGGAALQGARLVRGGDGRVPERGAGGPAHGHVAARRGAHRPHPHRASSSPTTRASFPTAGDRRSGRTWAAAGATRPSARSSSRWGRACRTPTHFSAS